MTKMALDHPRLLASLTVLLIGIPACTTAPAEETIAAGIEMVEPETGATVVESAMPQDPQQQSLQEQRRRALVRKYLSDAATLRAGGDLDAALLQAMKAQQLEPANDDVNNLITAINAELGTPAGTAQSYGEQLIRMQQLAEDRRRADVQNRLQSASQAMDQSNYILAIQDLRMALLAIEVGPTTDWGSLDQQARDLLQQAQDAQDEQQVEAEAALTAEYVMRLREESRLQQDRLSREVSLLLTRAAQAYRERQFKLAQDLSFRALELDANSATANDLHNAAVKSLRDSRTQQYYMNKSREIQIMQEELEELRIPQTDILRLDPVIWQRALDRGSRGAPLGIVMDPVDQATMDQVQSTPVGKLTFTAETGDYREVVTVLQTLTGVPILIDADAREVVDTEGLVLEIELISPITLESFLNQMVDRSEDLAWRVIEGVVMITTKINAGGNNILFSYDVRDLVFERTSFIPPQIHEIPTGSLETSEEPRTGGESEDKLAVVEPDLLVTNIKEFTGVDYWEEEGGGTIDPTDTGYLIVNANPEMHQAVTSLLNDIRRFNTSVVSIDSKFLNVTRAFLQEVGVDWRGLGGDDKGTVALLDDVTNGLDDNASRGGDNSGTGDPAANPVSGAFFNDGADGDVRARTENYFSNDLGRFLGTDGGLTAGVTLLDSLQLQAIFTAIEKRSNVEVVNSQMLTVLNNERGHVAIINQTAYVRDFDVEVAQASFIADPIVDVIQDGVVLDVRPVISYDRKYVTMHLEPTVADLQRPIPTFTTSLGGSTLPVTFQLPTLTVTTFATNAKVPDGGSVLLGGLRQVFSRERTATVPILGSIPILSFFFKQEGISDESFSLMVLVRAHITDVHDLALGK